MFCIGQAGEYAQLTCSLGLVPPRSAQAPAHTDHRNNSGSLRLGRRRHTYPWQRLQSAVYDVLTVLPLLTGKSGGYRGSDRQRRHETVGLNSLHGKPLA